MEVESPYEVHDYSKQFLGETAQVAEFAAKFIEKRIEMRKKVSISNEGHQEVNKLLSLKTGSIYDIGPVNYILLHYNTTFIYLFKKKSVFVLYVF
jgi:hypothetical protein